jgi:fermentation-respiration switch protein FrsA (DUF1100 family)
MAMNSSWRRWIPWRGLRAAVIIYLSVLLMLRFVENRLIFAPRREPYNSWRPPTPEARDVAFTASDGTKLTGWYMPHPQPQAVALFTCGNGGNMSYWRDYFRTLHQRCRVSLLGFDYRGYGRSDGSPSEAGVLDDARSARRWLADEAGLPEDRIVVIGRSIGGGVAIDLATDGARALVVENTFTSLPEIAARLYPFLPVRWAMRTRFDSLKKIAGYRGPLFISHGDADELVPFEMGKQLFDAAGSTMKRFHVVHNGEHNDPQPEEYYEALSAFLAELP